MKSTANGHAESVLTYEGIGNGLPILQLEVAQVVCLVVRHIDITGSYDVESLKASRSLYVPRGFFESIEGRKE